MKSTPTNLSLTPAASPRKIPRVVPRSSQPGDGAAVRLSRSEEIKARVLRGERPKEIMADLGISGGRTHALIREAGFVLMRVTKAERDQIIQARFTPFLADPAAKVPVELKQQPKPTRPGRRENMGGGGA